MKLDVIIIEDEPNNLALLKELLAAHVDFVTVTGEAGGVESAVQLLSTVQPHILLLDIEIKGGTGFDVLERLGKYDFEVIFTTAFAQYALDAIKKRAFDYLLKPVKAAELVEALAACRERIIEKKGYFIPQEVEQAEKYLVHKSTDGQEMLLFDDILYFRANGAYTEVALKKQQKIISKNIGELEEILPAGLFFRTHHSFIVNANYIQRAELKRSGFLELTDGTVIPVSQRKKQDFIRFLKTKK